MRIARRIIDQHKELREIAAEALFRTAVVAENLGSAVSREGEETPRAELLREAADRLLNDSFTLSVVGEFSRGKSTLINALLGRADLLPTSIEPTTATITVLTAGETPEATVHYEDGSVREGIAVEELPRYVLGRDLDGSELREKMRQKVTRFKRGGKTSRLTPAEVRADARTHAEQTRVIPEVTRVDVRYPSPFLQNGIRIVDTPGLGSVNPKHGAATRAFITESDAVLFLINTDPVISASECNFLTFLRDYVDQFLFVVTKIDRYDREERERSVRYTTETIAEHADIPAPQVFPVSAKLALEAQEEDDYRKLERSGFPEFYEALDAFLIDGRGQRILREYVGTARMHALDLRKSIKLELHGIELSLEERRTRVEHCRKYLKRAQEMKEHVLDTLGRRLGDLVDSLVTGPTHTGRLRLTSSLREQIHAEIDRYTWQQLNEASQTIPILVDELVSRRLQELVVRVTEQVRRVRDGMAQECFQILHELDQNLGLEFEGVTTLTPEEFALRIEPDRFRSSLKRITTATIGSTLCVALAEGFRFGGIGALVMMGGEFLARTGLANGFLEQARTQVKEAVEEPLRQLITVVLDNVKERVAECLADYGAALGEMLSRAISAIEESLSRMEHEMSSARFNAADRLEELHEQLRSLDEIDGILARARPG